MWCFKKLSILSIIAFLTACGSPNNERNLYYWGGYHDLVYQYYEETGNWAEQEVGLQEIITQSKANNKSVGPGVYAHLGLVYLKQGKNVDAQNAFAQEQMLYPESQTLIQFLQRQKR